MRSATFILFPLAISLATVGCHRGGDGATGSPDGAGIADAPGDGAAGLAAAAVSPWEIDLTWSAAAVDPAGTAAGYYIYRDGVQWGHTTSIAFADTALAASRTYTYTVAPYDASGTAGVQSPAAQATTLDPVAMQVSFGVHTNHYSSWPVQTPFDTLRNLSFTGLPHTDNLEWPSIQIANNGDDGDFDFRGVDAAMQAVAQQAQVAGHPIDVQYTWELAPQLVALPDQEGYKADGTPTTCTCGNTMNSPTGTCSPPTDLDADGGGANAYFKRFITALATHVHQAHLADPTHYADITFWDGGNEWYDHAQFCASYAQEVRVLADITCIIKGVGPGCTQDGINQSAKIMTAAMSDGGRDAKDDQWDGTYLATAIDGATPAQLADIMNFHCYEPGNADPEQAIIDLVGIDTSISYGQPGTPTDAYGKPMYCSEGGWLAHDNDFPASWEAAADWLPRYLIAMASTNIMKFVVFGYDFDTNLQSQAPDGITNLWSKTEVTGACDHAAPGGGFFCTTAAPWTQVYNWLDGATMSGPCSATGTQWVCPLTRSGGYQAQAIWDTSQTCTNGVCTSVAITVPAIYTQYRTLAGAVAPIPDSHVVPVGLQPILVEN